MNTTNKSQQKRAIFEAQVIDRLMHNKYLPFTVCKGMVSDYAGTCEWSRLFGKSPEVTAALVYQRAYHSVDDIDFIPIPSGFVGADF